MFTLAEWVFEIPGKLSHHAQARTIIDTWTTCAARLSGFKTITSQSATTRMSINNYQAKAGPNGLQLVEMGSQEDVVAGLRGQP
jgi:hypothetical protein